jgi:hypothetical protein
MPYNEIGKGIFVWMGTFFLLFTYKQQGMLASETGKFISILPNIFVAMEVHLLFWCVFLEPS